MTVDIQEDVSTYDKCYGVELTEENEKQFLSIEGFTYYKGTASAKNYSIDGVSLNLCDRV